MHPSPDDKLVGDAVLDFSRGLHSDLPLRHFGEFHDPGKLKDVVEQQKEKVFRNVFDQVWTRERDEVVALFTKLNQRMDKEVIAEWLAKNREHEIRSVSFLQRWVEKLCDNFHVALEYQLLLHPDMELQSLKNYVEEMKQIATNVLESIWKPGNAQMQDERKSKLEKQLQVLEEEVFEKHQRSLEGKTIDEGKTLLGEVGTILLERARQLKSYVVKHQGQVSTAILKGMVEEMLQYLLKGKGSALKDSQEEIYSKSVQILDKETKFLTEGQFGKMTAENLVGFTESLEDQLRSCYFENDGDKAHEMQQDRDERDPKDKTHRWITMREILKELKGNQLESLDLEGNEQNGSGSTHESDLLGSNDVDKVPRGDSGQSARGKGRSVKETRADSNDPALISGTAMPAGVPLARHEREVAREVFMATRVDGDTRRRSSRVNKAMTSNPISAPTRSSSRISPHSKNILHDLELTEKLRSVVNGSPNPNCDVESMISPNSSELLSSTPPPSLKVNDRTNESKNSLKDFPFPNKPKRSENAISRTTRRASARKSIPRASSERPQLHIFKSKGCQSRPRRSDGKVCHKNVAIVSDDDPKYFCGVCKRKFKERKRRNYHAKFCGMDKKKAYICDKCGKGFHDKGNLNKHILVHTREKLFECPKCPKRFTQKAHLQGHIRCHDNENVFICKPCNITFLSRRTLHEHKLAKHEGKLPFACSHCDQRYDRMSKLRNHVIIHGDERPFKCPKCEACFTRMDNLVFHIQKTHNQEKRTAQKLAYDASIAYLLAETKDESCRDIPVNRISASVVNHVIKKANLLSTNNINNGVTTGLSSSS